MQWTIRQEKEVDVAIPQINTIGLPNMVADEIRAHDLVIEVVIGIEREPEIVKGLGAHVRDLLIEVATRQHIPVMKREISHDRRIGE